MKRITYFFGFLILAGFLAAGITSCEAPAEEKYVGIQLWSVRGDMQADPAGTLQQLGDMGYSYVEAAGYQNGMFYGMEPEAFTDLVEASGLEFISSHIGRELPSEEGYEEAMQWWRTAIDAHERAGVEYMVQPFMPRSAFDSLAVLQKWADYFNTIGQMASERGIKFGFHNHAIEFTEVEGVIAYDYLLQNTDPGLVFFQLDLYWIVEGGQNANDYFARYPGRFLMFHVKDAEELGASGKMDFGPAFNSADQAGMEYYIVEVEQYNYEPIESVRVSLEFLQNAEFVGADYR